MRWHHAEDMAEHPSENVLKTKDETHLKSPPPQDTTCDMQASRCCCPDTMVGTDLPTDAPAFSYEKDASRPDMRLISALNDAHVVAYGSSLMLPIVSSPPSS